MRTDEIKAVIREPDSILAVGVFGVIEIDHPYNDKLLKFYAGVYGRETEIADLTSPTRHVTYECFMDNKYKMVFTGCEVTQLGSIPKGMNGWQITSNKLRIYGCSNGRSCLADTSIAWKWRTGLHAFNQTFTAGDFTASDLVISGTALGNPPYDFLFSENTYVDYSGEGFEDDEIHLSDPDPKWVHKFQILRNWITETLGDGLALRIEHYGSTSITGIPAKPIIDILVEIPSFERLRREIVPKLCGEDCSYSHFMNHATFTKRTAFKGERVAHIHMAPKGHDVWKGIGFRDYLRSHPDLVREYADLKRNLAMRYYNDRNHYTMGKEAFIEKVAVLSST